MMNNKLLTGILILLTNITVYSSDYIATEFCEAMVEELSYHTLGTEEDVERVKKIDILECRKAIFVSSKKNEIIFVDNQCKDNCSKIQAKEVSAVAKKHFNNIETAAIAGAKVGAVTPTGPIIGAATGAVLGGGGAVIVTGAAIALSANSIEEKNNRIDSDHKRCLEGCE